MAFTNGELGLITNMTGYIARVIKLSDLGRMDFINLNDEVEAISALTDLSLKHDLELINGEVKRAYALIKLGAVAIKTIDFTDMIFLPLHYNLNTEKYNFVFIDECQDLNTCQRMLMQKALGDNGRFIAVGDRNQAIYGFAGADANSFSKLVNMPNTIELPLSVSYRCGKNIIAKAKNIVPSIEAHENAKNGVVENVTMDVIKSGDMVLCRLTFPLVAMCLQYLKQGIKAHLMGSDIGKNLIKLLEETMRKTEAWTIENMFSRLYADKDKLCASIMRKENLTQSEAQDTSTYKTFEEKIDVITLLSQGMETPNDIIKRIEIIFSDDKKEGILLSTIHKSKGLESDRVYIIHPEKMPCSFAKKDWQIEQENNLKYVAFTRAKSVLGFVTDFDAYAGFESKETSVQPLKESNFIGKVGEKIVLDLEVITVNHNLNSKFGNTSLYEFRDKNGNIFSKFGVVSSKYLISNHADVEVGSRILVNATVSKHQEYRGVKYTVLNYLSQP